MRLMWLVVLSFLFQSVSAKCAPNPIMDTPIPPYVNATLDWLAGVSLDSPKSFILSSCDPMKPQQDFDSYHNYYNSGNRLDKRGCKHIEITNFTQLEAVSLLFDNEKDRRSRRATPANISVRWPSLGPVLRTIAERLWPLSGRRLRAQLQAVLSYREGGFFSEHYDMCETNGQEGVLIVDLGLRRTYGNRDEMFFYGLDSNSTDCDLVRYNEDTQQRLTKCNILGTAPIVGTWHASQAGDWVAFPMHRKHGVYERVKGMGKRAVAVFNLIDPKLIDKPLCSPYAGSCLKYDCQPGRPCLQT